MMSASIHARMQRLCIVCPSWVGDTVMATPVFRALRAHLPQAHISAVMRPGLEQVLDGNPWLDAMQTVGDRGVRGAMQLARAIRLTRAEAVLLLTNSFRTALAARISGTPVRIGYARDGRAWLLTDRVPAPSSATPTPAVHYYASLLCHAIGFEEINQSLELHVTDDARSHAARMLSDVLRPFALINPGANKQEKRWPAARFAQLARRLHDELAMDIVITGSPAEQPILHAIASTADVPITNIADRGVTLASLKAVVERASVMITNDTGPRHIAAALKTPLVTLFGPTDPRWTTLPGVCEHPIVAEPFLPADLVADDHPRACDIERITVGDVVHAVRNIAATGGDA